MPYPNKWGVNSGIALFRLDRLRETGWAVAIDNIMTQVLRGVLGMNKCRTRVREPACHLCAPSLHSTCPANRLPLRFLSVIVRSPTMCLTSALAL